MAGLIEKLKVFVGVDDDYEEDYAEEDYEPRKPAQTYGLRDAGHERVWEPRVSRSAPYESGYTSPPPRSPEKENLVHMQKGSDTLRVLTQRFKIVVIEPHSFEDCPKLVDSLKARKPVIINLERIETDGARKIFDFLSGATYALAGNVQKISNNIFVFLPENVDVSTNTEHKGSITFGAEDGNPWRQ
jgi:cell division inhibitor SepF